MNAIDELLLRDLIRLGSIFTLLGIHVLVFLYGTMSGRRGRRTAIAYLLAFDWALMMGVTAGRSVAGGDTPFWSLHTAVWAFLGILLLFLPAWLLFRFGLRFSGIFLLPVMPTDRGQRQQAGHTLHAYAWGSNSSFYREEDGELRELVKGGTKLPKGGPGFVMTSSHYAVPLTTGTRDTRVGGQGLIFTKSKERPRPLVDLRPQARTREVHALTRDGIPIKVKMTAAFQIASPETEGDVLYPFDPQAVFAAVHAQGVSPDQQEEGGLGWEQIVVDRAAGLLRAAVARTLLDRLLESADGDASDGDPPRETLRAGVKEELAEAMKPHGIEVQGVGLGNIEVEDQQVLEQRVESWAARWERRRSEKKAQAEAEATRLVKEARADAQRHMIVAISEAFQQLADTGTPIVPADVIALRFIDVLEEVTASPPVRALLPETVQGLPVQLRLLMERTAAGEEDEDEAAQ